MQDQDIPPAMTRQQVLEQARELSGLLAVTDEATLVTSERRRQAIDAGLAALAARDRAGEVIHWSDDVEPVLGDLMALVADEQTQARQLATAAAVLVQMVEHALVMTDAEVESRAAAMLMQRMAARADFLPVQ